MVETSDWVFLASDDIELALVPDLGGSLAYFRWRGIHVMRPLTSGDAAARNVLGAAMFPMVPFANRVTGNTFTIDGRRYHLQPNVEGQRFHVHGTGWQLPWRVDRAATETSVLSLDVQAGVDPFSYRATQSFHLHSDGFEVGMELINLGEERMPMGMGLHPWFRREPEIDVEFEARHFYLEGPDYTSGERTGLPAELDFSRPRHLPDRWLNNDFGDWKGNARIRFPADDFTVTITADSVFNHLMVYSDPAAPFFCIEPQSNAAGALNRMAQDNLEGDLAVLGPGECLSGRIRFRVDSGVG